MKRTELSTDLRSDQAEFKLTVGQNNQPRQLEASALSPQTWPFGLEWLPPAAYLVGGNVRDALLGRQAEYLDLDFVLPEAAVRTAKMIANHYRAGFVLLDAERQIARVVFERATVDFAQQVGLSLEEDLEHRDFTVNAIAYDPHTAQVIDPLHGYSDLQLRLIRMVCLENLKEDPLRLLRAYRQAAQLGFTIEYKTRKTIQQLAGLLQFVAAERVQSELSYLLGSASSTPFLKLAWQDRLLAAWLPHATAEGLERVAAVDQAAELLVSTQSGLELSGWLRDQQRVSGSTRSWLKVAKLTGLLAPDPEMAERELWRLKYSRAEIQAVLAVMSLLPQVEAMANCPPSAREQYYLFRAIGAAFPALAVVGIASGVPLTTMTPLIERYLTLDDPIAHPQPLLTGRDLMAQLKLPPSPTIGHLLEAIQLAHAEGKITTQAEALEFAKTLL
ncbi:CCA tRNA nucleotidyltransferase [Leptolyngbya sp. NK1-12]|uniref:CCA tRNA nucleotidyltransferase n=1 Tax=Leptolyngbya sp. NK1-12 TaxID=2547451 RepID=UPI00292E42B1|nr:CCA tRNA nucleotidyltransferase [Leptolyngbya sp. NK1-12]